MEPPDLNRPIPDDARLDAWLCANATVAPLPDNGFSRRVLANLPPQVERAASRRRIVFCLGGALVGAVVPWLTDAGRPDPATSPVELSRIAQQALRPLADPNVVLALVVTGLCLLYVFAPPKRDGLSSR
jgi:hypothetical protein